MRALCRGPQKTGHVHRVGELSVALDLFSPSWKGRERHSVRTDLADELLIQAAREVTWREVPVLRRLLFDHFGGERLDPDQPIIEGFLTGGSYSLLHDGGSEIVIGLGLEGMFARTARKADRHTFLLRPTGQQARVVLCFAAKDGELTTETRVDVGSLGMRLAFYAYWALIRMPSGLIRRHWLAAVVRRATAEHLRGSAITEHRKYEHR